MSRRSHQTDFVGGLLLSEHSIGNLTHHLLQQKPEMAVGSIVGGSDMPYAFCSRRQIEALPKTRSSFVIGIINRDRLAAVFLNYGKARNIGWPIPNIDHIRKRNRANIVGHVVVNVLRQIEQTFVDSKKILRFL